MKICTITFLNASNFGAALQCTALSHVLKASGSEVEVINYVPDYVKEKQGVLKEMKKAVSAFGSDHHLTMFLRGLVKGLCYAMHYPALSCRQKAFQDFLSANIKLTKEYRAFSELREDSPEADIMICGSDQIWNSALTGGSLDPAFFLGFAPEGTKKIAYGVSLGELNIEDHAGELVRLTYGFAGISVREKSSARALDNVLKQKISVVLDPTMLISREEYAPLEAVITEERPYLLLYNIQNSTLSVHSALTLARRKGLKIIDISPNPLRRVKGAKKLVSIGPGEFLAYVKNADCIVTNSFHGTVFSVIYQKEFYTVPHSTRSNRMEDLLGDLGLKKRLISDADQVCEADGDIDYGAVGVRLGVLRDRSIHFLKMAVYQ